MDETRDNQPAIDELARQIDQQMHHAWMVRTFLKHAPESEANPELMEVVRNIFDTARALESRPGATGKITMLIKNHRKLDLAASRFAELAPKVSDHENFRQAVGSLNASVAELMRLVELARSLGIKADPAKPRTKEWLPADQDDLDINLDDL